MVIVILVVDGVHFCTRPHERCNGAREVITRLVDIYRDMSAENATVKILFAGPSRSDL